MKKQKPNGEIFRSKEDKAAFDKKLNERLRQEMMQARKDAKK